jgi:hypothetical protein
MSGKAWSATCVGGGSVTAVPAGNTLLGSSTSLLLLCKPGDGGVVRHSAETECTRSACKRFERQSEQIWECWSLVARDERSDDFYAKLNGGGIISISDTVE